MRAGRRQAQVACWLLATIERVQLTRADTMRRRFRFTHAQAWLAETLCAGMRPTPAAAPLGVKISTVRTRVGQRHEKAGTRSQAQRVALSHAVSGPLGPVCPSMGPATGAPCPALQCAA
ncbi:MAG: hypothetical protein C0505_12285 [Leptothrix sp. (in: Bacteria)]|nr:hypothetical protein [Leptothrix sp. (in: b-proteobacteria)]